MNSIGRWVRVAVERLVLLGALAVLFAGPADAAAPLTDAELGAWIEKLEGAWAASASETSLGSLPLALLFERQPDGSLRAHTAANRDNWIELRFHRAADGVWHFTQGMRLAGIGEQWHTMTLLRSERDALVWGDEEDPSAMRCRIAIETTRLEIHVLQGGVELARFRLPRLEDRASIETLRRTLRAARLQPEPAGPAVGDDPSLDPRDARR